MNVAHVKYSCCIPVLSQPCVPVSSDRPLSLRQPEVGVITTVRSVYAAFLTVCLESEKTADAVGTRLAIGPASDWRVRK